jgi:hypothetical protein
MLPRLITEFEVPLADVGGAVGGGGGGTAAPDGLPRGGGVLPS